MQLSALLVIFCSISVFALDPCLYHFTETQIVFEESGSNTTKGAGVWKLQVGGHVKAVNVKRLTADGAGDGFDLALTAQDELHAEGVQSTAEAEEFFREADLSKRGIKENDWYLICLTSTVIADNKPTTCNRCTVKKACKGTDGSCTTRFVNSTLVYRLTTRNQAVVSYFVQDLPGASAVLKSKVFFKPADRYCAPALYDEAVKTIETTITPNSIAYVTVDGLKAKENYFVNTDATLKTKDGKSYELVNYISGGNRDEIRSCPNLPQANERSC